MAYMELDSLARGKASKIGVTVAYMGICKMLDGRILARFQATTRYVEFVMLAHDTKLFVYLVNF